MCGFLGEVNDTLLSNVEFKQLLDLSVHRGPDEQDFWKDSSCQLGFNRLSIIDVSDKAMQPVVSPSGRYVIVFNGEIYNYKELQKYYGIDESALRCQSDTEILAHLIDRLTFDEFAKSLNGMFAIAVWDRELEQLYLLRDFAGIKPLFYGLTDRGIVFASQFDQIFKHPEFKANILRPSIMKEFFALGYMQAPNTVFENIYQLEPGGYLVWSNRQKEVVIKDRYFDWITSSDFLDSNPETLDKFNSIFEDVIKRQLRADVPLATFLSSGYDSTLVAAFAKKEKNDIKAFTFGIDKPEFDESPSAKKYAKLLDITHNVSSVQTSDLLRIIDEHFTKLSEPFGDYSSVPSYLITQKAKQYATVMLSGDGADELFWGYPRFKKSINQAFWFNYPLWVRKIIIPFLRKKQKDLSRALERIGTFSNWILFKQTHFTDIDVLFPEIDFSPELKELYTLKGGLKKENVLQYLKYNEYYAHMQRTLKKVDLTSMANSLEVRVPFLDRDTILFSNKIESKFMINHTRPKLILKDTLYRFININQVSKTKKGFSVPVKDWLAKELKRDFLETVLETPFFGESFLDKIQLEKCIDDFYKGKKVDAWGLWHLYAWQKWALNNGLV